MFRLEVSFATVPIGGLVAAALIACAPVLLANAGAARAAATQWQATDGARARLIGGATLNEKGGHIRQAGIEIKLAPGWHTYWRYPGDAGLPPRFDFARSENVASVDVLWPAPQLFTGEDGDTIGYTDDVIFPLRVVPRDADKPVVLRVALGYAVCEKRCVPADAQLELQLPAQSPEEASLVQARARVPKRLVLGAQAPLSVRAVSVTFDRPTPRVVVDLAVPAGTHVDLFAEGPTAEWALPVPKPIAGAPPGLRRFAFDLDGLPPGQRPADAKGVAITLTAVTPAQAIESIAHLD